MDRRTFLKQAGITGGAVIGAGAVGACSPELPSGPPIAAARPTGPTAPASLAPGRPILDMRATESPIDHIVVLMMENRSFDHWLGWLATDESWLEAGRSRYGRRFNLDGMQQQQFASPTGPVSTAHLLDYLEGGNPWRGCGHPDPGHGWDAGRAQRDGGFLAPGSRNDPFALGYYRGEDLPFTSALAKRFTVCDRSHASVLGPTYPNREYLHGAQSGGEKTNRLPFAEGGFTWPTIWDRLATAGVSHGYYYTDLPVTALWGQKLLSFSKPIDDFFARCADGTLPQVSFVDPGFLTGSRTDNHPHGDVRAGEAFQRDVFAAFARSPHWQHGLFVLTYDEWGGFFDHVRPPILADDRSSGIDADNFSQAGFRVPTILASPYARAGSVDHDRYDHTSILRFIEWRFLGAPAQGVGGRTKWWLTARDRNARNIGASLVSNPDREIGMDLDVAVDPPSLDCDAAGAGTATASTSTPDPAATPVGYQKHSFEDALDEGYFERVGFTPKPSLMTKDWVF
ncbi:MAG: alkaline phosphatase family protein [Aquihabitans sp.]